MYFLYNNLPTFALIHTSQSKLDKLKKTLTALFALFLFLGHAQEEKIIIMDMGRKKDRSNQNRKLVDADHVFKFSPLQMMVGEINIGLEKRVDEMSSIEFEIGPTLSKVGLVVSNNHYNPLSSGSSGETTSLGFFGSVGYRFYPMDNTVVLNRFYVSPIFKYRLYRMNMVDYTDMLEDRNGSEGHAMFMFNFGYQHWLSDHFSLDFFGGLGLVYENHNKYYTQSIYDGNTGTYTYSWAEDKYDGVRVGLSMGLKVGIGK